MKVLGTDGSSVIVKLEYVEWIALGGKTKKDRNGYATCECYTEQVPSVLKIAEALEKIRAASPDLERIRASFQAFLMLTDPAAVGEVLKSCGVAEPIVEDVVEIKEGDSEE